MQKPEKERNYEGPPSPDSDVMMDDMTSQFYSPRFCIPSQQQSKNTQSKNNLNPSQYSKQIPKKNLQYLQEDLCSAEVDSCSNEELTEKIKMMKQRIKQFKFNDHQVGSGRLGQQKQHQQQQHNLQIKSQTTNKQSFGPNFFNPGDYPEGNKFQSSSYINRQQTEGASELSPRQLISQRQKEIQINKEQKQNHSTNEKERDSYVNMTNSMLEERIKEIKKKMNQAPQPKQQIEYTNQNFYPKESSDAQQDEDVSATVQGNKGPAIPSNATDLARVKNSKLFQKFMQREKGQNTERIQSTKNEANHIRQTSSPFHRKKSNPSFSNSINNKLSSQVKSPYESNNNQQVAMSNDQKQDPDHFYQQNPLLISNELAISRKDSQQEEETIMNQKAEDYHGGGFSQNNLEMKQQYYIINSSEQQQQSKYSSITGYNTVVKSPPKFFQERSNQLYNDFPQHQVLKQNIKEDLDQQKFVIQKDSRLQQQAHKSSREFQNQFIDNQFQNQRLVKKQIQNQGEDQQHYHSRPTGFFPNTQYNSNNEQIIASQPITPQAKNDFASPTNPIIKQSAYNNGLSTIPPESAQRFNHIEHLHQSSIISQQNELMGFSQKIQPVGNQYPQFIPPPQLQGYQWNMQAQNPYGQMNIIPIQQPLTELSQQQMQSHYYPGAGQHSRVQSSVMSNSGLMGLGGGAGAGAISILSSNLQPQQQQLQQQNSMMTMMVQGNDESSNFQRNNNIKIQENNQELVRSRQKLQQLQKEFIQNNDENRKLNNQLDVCKHIMKFKVNQSVKSKWQNSKMKNHLLMQEIEELRNQLQIKDKHQRINSSTNNNDRNMSSDQEKAKLIKQLQDEKAMFQAKKALQSSHIQDLQSQLSSVESKLEQTKRKELEVQSKYQSLRFESQLQIQKNLQISNSNSSALQRQQDLRNQISQLKQQLLSSECRLGSKIDDQVSLKKLFDSSKLESQRLKTNEFSLQRQLNERDHQISYLQTELADLKQKHQNELNSNRILSTDNQSLRNQVMLQRNQIDLQSKVGDQLKDETFSLKQQLAEYEKRQLLNQNTNDTMQRQLNQVRLQLNFSNQRLQSQNDSFLNLQTQFNQYMTSESNKHLVSSPAAPTTHPQSSNNIPTIAQQHIKRSNIQQQRLPNNPALMGGDRDNILPPSSVISSTGRARQFSGDSARANIGQIPMSSSRPGHLNSERNQNFQRQGGASGNPYNNRLDIQNSARGINPTINRNNTAQNQNSNNYLVGYSPHQSQQAHRMPQSVNMVPGISTASFQLQNNYSNSEDDNSNNNNNNNNRINNNNNNNILRSQETLSSNGSSADIILSSNRGGEIISSISTAPAARRGNETSSVLSSAFSWNPPDQNKVVVTQRQQQAQPQKQESKIVKSENTNTTTKGGFNFLPSRKQSQQQFSSIQQPKLDNNQQVKKAKIILPSQEQYAKREQTIKNIQGKLMTLQIEKEKMQSQFVKIPEGAKTIKDRKRRSELEMEIGILNSSITSLKQKLRNFNALHRDY